MENALSYHSQGRGEVVVLLHGFCENKSVWNGIMPELSKNYNVISIDLPGFGDSDLLGLEPSIEAFSSKVQEVLTLLKVHQCVVIGHSMGGYVALALAELFPQLIKGMVMFHSSAAGDNDEKKEKRNKSIEFVKNQGSAAFVTMLIPTLFKEENKSIFASELSALSKNFSSISPQAIIDSLIAMRDRKDRVKFLESVSFPVLYIIGKFDAAIPLKSSLEQCHLAAESYACFLSNSGHMGMIEEANKSLKVISNFLNLVYQN